MPRYLFFFNHDKPFFKTKAEHRLIAWGRLLEQAKGLNCTSISQLIKLGFKIKKEDEMFRYIEEELDNLSPEWRNALISIDHTNMSYQEYADSIGIKLGTVKSRVHRARAKVKEMREDVKRNTSENVANVAQ